MPAAKTKLDFSMNWPLKSALSNNIADDFSNLILLCLGLATLPGSALRVMVDVMLVAVAMEEVLVNIMNKIISTTLPLGKPIEHAVGKVMSSFSKESSLKNEKV